MQVIKQSRLSVSKVSQKEWDFIVDNLIEGYEEQDDNDDDGLAGVKVGGGPPLDPNLNGGQAVAGAYMDEPESNVPDLPTVPAIHGAEGSDEIHALTSGTALPTTTQATSRPTSRQGSRPVSRAGSYAAARSLAAPMSLTTETYMDMLDVEASETGLQMSSALEPTSPVPRTGSVKPGVSSRASSRFLAFRVL